MTKYEFPGDKTPIIKGSAKALEGDTCELGEPAILKLMEAVDSYIPSQSAIWTRVLDGGRRRILDTGRGTVVTGRVERGIVKVAKKSKSWASSRPRRRRDGR